MKRLRGLSPRLREGRRAYLLSAVLLLGHMMRIGSTPSTSERRRGTLTDVQPLFGSAMSRWFVLVCVVLSVASSVVRAHDGERPLIFVADVTAPPAHKSEAELWTAALCDALTENRRVEVLCAPDVRQMLSFAAMGSFAGNGGASAAVLQERLGAVSIVVTATLTPQAPGTVVLVVAAGHRAPAGMGDIPVFEAAAIRVEETLRTTGAKPTQQLSALSSRVVRTFLPPQTTASPPPDPLK